MKAGPPRFPGPVEGARPPRVPLPLADGVGPPRVPLPLTEGVAPPRVPLPADGVTPPRVPAPADGVAAPPLTEGVAPPRVPLPVDGVTPPRVPAPADGVAAPPVVDGVVLGRVPLLVEGVTLGRVPPLVEGVTLGRVPPLVGGVTLGRVPLLVEGVTLGRVPPLVEGVTLGRVPPLVEGVTLGWLPPLGAGVTLGRVPPLVEGVTLGWLPPLGAGVTLGWPPPPGEGAPPLWLLPPPPPLGAAWLAAGCGALAGSAWWALGVVFLGWSARTSPSPQAETAASTAPAQNAWPTLLLKFTAASNQNCLPDTNEQHHSTTRSIPYVSRFLLAQMAWTRPAVSPTRSQPKTPEPFPRQAKTSLAARASQHIMRFGRYELQYFNRPPAICQGSSSWDFGFPAGQHRGGLCPGQGRIRRRQGGDGGSSQLPQVMLCRLPALASAASETAGSPAGFPRQAVGWMTVRRGVALGSSLPASRVGPVIGRP